MFRIYYDDGDVVEGSSRGSWKNARNDGVQVVVSFPRTQPIKWHYVDPATGKIVVVKDRDLWTGVHEYDPFGYGLKVGSLLSDAQYFAIWERACGDPSP